MVLSGRQATMAGTWYDKFLIIISDDLKVLSGLWSGGCKVEVECMNGLVIQGLHGSASRR